MTAEEFIANAQAGKYKNGDVVNVSAIYEGDLFNGDPLYFYFFFGPKVNGTVLMAKIERSSSDILPFTGGRLQKGDMIIMRGEYAGSIVLPDVYGKKQTGIVLYHARKVS